MVSEHDSDRQRISPEGWKNKPAEKQVADDKPSESVQAIAEKAVEKVGVSLDYIERSFDVDGTVLDIIADAISEGSEHWRKVAADYRTAKESLQAKLAEAEECASRSEKHCSGMGKVTQDWIREYHKRKAEVKRLTGVLREAKFQIKAVREINEAPILFAGLMHQIDQVLGGEEEPSK